MGKCEWGKVRSADFPGSRESSSGLMLHRRPLQLDVGCSVIRFLFSWSSQSVGGSVTV